MKILAAALIVAAILVPAVLIGANGDGAGNVTQPLGGVRTDKTSYALGEVVKISFIIENRSDQEITLGFSSGQQYDIWVNGPSGEVWRWSRGKVFTQALTSITLKPRERKTFQETWSQMNNAGEQVGPGSYTLFAQLTTFPPRPNPVKTTFTAGTAKAVVAPTTVSGITDNLNKSLGQLVQLSGTYLGWKPDPDSPNCRPGPPVMRTDWAISDNTGCIFITGQNRLHPTDDIGRQVTVSGYVRKTEKGQPYIEATAVSVSGER